MIPPYINKNAKIYLVAPSFGCTTSPYKERLEKTLITLPKKGHEVIIGPNCFLSEGKSASNTKNGLRFHPQHKNPMLHPWGSSHCHSVRYRLCHREPA